MQERDLIPASPDEEGSLRKLRATENLRREVTPKTLTDYWRTKFEVDGRIVGIDIEVPDCNWTQEEIDAPMKRRGSRGGIDTPGRLLYLPKELTGRDGLVRIGKMYPQLIGRKAEGSYTLDEDTKEEEWVTDIHDNYGWIKVEASHITPNRNTAEEDLKIFANEQGYFMQRECAFILASLQSKDLTNNFYDEIDAKRKNWSRLGGSQGGGGTIAACFYPEDGHLRVLLAVDPDQKTDQLGGRFEEVKK